MVPYSNILVIQTAFIGDAILASSLLEKLHKALPGARVSILVREGNGQIFHQHPFLHEVLEWKKKARKIRNLLSLVKLVRKRRFDCVINGHRYLSSGLVAAFSGARHIAGFKENPLSFFFNHTARHTIGDGTHEVERLNRLVADFAPGAAERPALYPAAVHASKVSHLIVNPYVCIAPASVWFTKQLPPEKWVTLCNSMPPQTTIYLLGAPDDAQLCTEIKSASLHAGIRVLAGELSLLESCALMKEAQMNYVNDSAPLHLASSVNAPATAFFCSTVPAFGFGPLSDNATVLGVDELPCRPCGLHGYKACPLKHFKCGKLMPLPAAVTVSQ